MAIEGFCPPPPPYYQLLERNSARLGRVKKVVLTAFFLIGTVCAFLTMVAFLKFCYALLPVGTSELGEVAGRTRAPGFVRFVAAVKVPVALLILGHAEAIAALMILTLACTII